MELYLITRERAEEDIVIIGIFTDKNKAKAEAKALSINDEFGYYYITSYKANISYPIDHIFNDEFYWIRFHNGKQDI